MTEHEEKFNRIRAVSAKNWLSRWQKLAILIIFISLPLLCIIGGSEVRRGLMLCLVIWVAVNVFFKLVISSVSHKGVAKIYPEDRLPTNELPLYTILLPVAKEAEVITTLLRNVGMLNYPKDRLRVILLREASDTIMERAVNSITLPPYVHDSIVPFALEGPKTKPRALTWAVDNGLVETEFATIFDAEDRPDPDQLRIAVAAFAKYPEVSCFQASLQWYNADQNFYTRMMAANYVVNFAWMFPGSAAIGGVTPYGGTSQHLRMEHVKQVGSWDGRNVTEDADLGVRMFLAGYPAMMIESVTWEEATTSWRAQVTQMSRWIKGHTITGFAHSHRPFRLTRDLGFVGTLTFVILIFATQWSILSAILFWSLWITYFFTGAGFIQELFSPTAYYLGEICLGMNAIFAWQAMLGLVKTKQYYLIPWMILLPFYWIGVTLPAALKALWQLITKPFHWEKTAHGVEQKPKRKRGWSLWNIWRNYRGRKGATIVQSNN